MLRAKILSGGEIYNKGVIDIPRDSRNDLKINTNTYHVIIRGINKQDIFLDNFDKSKFFKELKMTKEEYKYEIYAYVLMNNHIHIVIHDVENNISDIFHKICMKYAMYFNVKYERVGHVFQNRFKSIGVDSDTYLLNLVRYIHRNPEKDGIGKMEDYAWSSYKEYVFKKNITNTELVLNLFSENQKEAIKRFEEFNKMQEDKYTSAEFEMENTITDEEAIEFIKRKLKIDNILSIQNYNVKKRNEMVYEIYKIKGITVKQICRLIGLNKSYVYEIIKNKNNNN